MLVLGFIHDDWVDGLEDDGRLDRRGRVLSAIGSAPINERGWARVLCPFCAERLGSPGRKATFGYNIKSGWYGCYRCDASGRLPSQAQDGVEDWSPRPAGEQEPAPSPLPPPEGFYALAGNLAVSLRPAHAYLAGRGVDASVVEAFGIGACIRGPMRGRVVVPLRDDDGAWRWYAGRAWSSELRPPYLYPKGGRAGVFFNGQALWRSEEMPALVVEGCFDAISLYPHGVAVLGTPGDRELELLCEAKRPLVFVLDGDAHEKGWILALKARMAGLRAGSVRLPPRLDPDEIPRQVIVDAALAAIESPSAEVVL